MKKVAFITECFPSEEKPYYCIYLYQQAKALAKLGYEIDIIMPDRTLSDGETKRSSFKGISILSIGYKTNKINSLLNIISKGFKNEFSKILITKKYDLISFSLCPYLVQNSVIKLAKKSKTASVIHIHGLNVFGSPYTKVKKIVALLNEFNSKKTIKMANGIIGVSDKVCDVVNSKLQRENVFTVYNGADENLFTPKEKNYNKDSFSILCVANLIEIKGHKYIIEAIRKVKEKYPNLNINAKFIGIGPYENELRKMSDNLDIELLGAKDYEEVCRYMQETDFYIMPSYYEAIGCVYLEAMLTATAVLGVKGCGIDEVITNKQNGYLVSPKNAQEVADAIIYAIENPEKHKEISQNGYNTVKENYTWEKSALAYSKVIEKLTTGER